MEDPTVRRTEWISSVRELDAMKQRAKGNCRMVRRIYCLLLPHLDIHLFLHINLKAFPLCASVDVLCTAPVQALPPPPPVRFQNFDTILPKECKCYGKCQSTVSAALYRDSNHVGNLRLSQ
jgi:hypothetical protein